MRIKHSMKSVMSGLLAAVTMLGSFPSVSVFAAQSNAYVDPADVWLATNNRTSELDANLPLFHNRCTVPNANLRVQRNVSYLPPFLIYIKISNLNKSLHITILSFDIHFVNP